MPTLLTSLTLTATVAVLIAVPGCPVNNEIPPPPAGVAPQCEGAGYTAFDVANHAEQDARLGAYEQIKVLLEEAVADNSLAAARFVTAQALYRDTAELQGKVQGRTDDRLPGRPNVGAELDVRIMAAFADGAAATSPRAIAIAAESIDKALVEFLYLSVFHELVQGQAAKWDEAFGYYGSGADNGLDAVRGFAGVAKRRDADNGTALEAQIFQALVDGSCTLATRLAADEVETIDVLNEPDMSAEIDEIDGAMRAVLALSVGHEAFEIGELQAALSAAPADAAMLDDARVKLVELDAFFRPLERLLRAEGGEDEAELLRAPIDAALDDDGDAWVDSFDAAAVIAHVENVFGVDVVR